MNRALALLGERDARDLLSTEMARVLSSSDLNVANLECPLIEAPSPAPKFGPVLGAPVSCAAGLRSLPVHVVGLANNHIMDHGRRGLLSTLRACRENEIACFGAGADLDSAAAMQIEEIGSLRVAMWAAADREFSTAAENRPGANPIDEIQMYHSLSKRRPWDVLIVLLHAGHHLYPWPSPRLQRLSRHLIELGASAVVCQHSHCVGAVERYEKGIIVYGQGNFLFDWIPNPGEEWSTGFVIQLDLNRNGIHAFEAIPYMQFAQEPRVDVLTGPARTIFFQSQSEMSQKVVDGDWIRHKWVEFSHRVEKDYYNLLRGLPLSGHVMQRITDELGIRWRPFTKKHRRILANLIRCEGHREVLETILTDEEDR